MPDISGPGEPPIDEHLCDPETCDCVCHTDPSIPCPRDEVYLDDGKIWLDHDHPSYEEVLDAIVAVNRAAGVDV